MILALLLGGNMLFDGKEVNNCPMDDYVKTLRNEIYLYTKLKFPKTTKEQVDYILNWYENILCDLDDQLEKTTKIIGDIYGGF